MGEPTSLKPFFAPLKDLLRWIEKAEVPHLIIGGIAASLLGRPRVTRDIDSLIYMDTVDLDRFYSMAGRFGFVPRRSDALAFAKNRRVLLMSHSSSGIDVDLSLGGLPFESEAIKRRHVVNVGGLRVPIPTPEDLIIMKAVAHRPIDLADIESLVDAHPKLDQKRIQYWVKEFAKVLEMPEIYGDLEKLIRSRRPSKKRGRQKRS